jgi:hypothetical protein
MKIDEMLLEEIREVRKDVKEIQKEISGLKIKVTSFATLFGIIGAYLKAKFLQ